MISNEGLSKDSLEKFEKNQLIDFIVNYKHTLI
jgi:hypothetical protein